jgi:N-acylneuraminate cytidylyltransferase
MIKYIIPARRNSKGLPFKNRKLICYTLDKLPKEVIKDTILSTDDEELIKIAKYYGINCVERDPSLALDETSTKDVILDLRDKHIINYCDTVVMLYLTYPERTWVDIENAINFYTKKEAKSLLCKKEITTTHPYLYMLEVGEFGGKQLTPHNLYRRQDYPKVFEISHFISIFDVMVLNNLNDNLYNQETIFYPIMDKIDVDTTNDFERFIN